MTGTLKAFVLAQKEGYEVSRKVFGAAFHQKAAVLKKTVLEKEKGFRNKLERQVIRIVGGDGWRGSGGRR